MRFIIDAQLPPALVDVLTFFGQHADHVAQLGLAAASDTEIWDRALVLDAAIITKDADFAQRRILSERGPAIVWIRLPNTRRRDLLEWFTKKLPEILVALASGEILIELI